MNTGRLARILGLLILVAAVSPFVVYGVPEVVGGEQSYVVLTGSMQPNINPGDAVVVESVAPAAVVSGDVITFTRGGESVPTTHRVTEVEETADGVRYWTKGDNNEDPDPQPVTPDRLVGRVMLTIPYIGYAVQFVNTDAGFAALVVAPIALFVLNEVWLVATSVRGRSSGDEAAGDADGAETPVAEHTEHTEHTAQTDVTLAVASDADDTAADPVAAPSAPSTVSDEADEVASGYSISRTDIRLAIVALAAFTAYSVWVATQLTEGWSVAVVAGTGASTLLLCGLYYAAGPAGSTEPTSSTRETPPEPSGGGQGLTDGGTDPAESADVAHVADTEDFWEEDDADA
ncbi:signal peptidase, endoplasmic reticulum-type [Halogranum gelatinilyticum]|uniref:Signal peptidase, endoplasmic reticulum-type n=1 Tax=Halogranum gelatinilyticum TaxID=660521 RepID=A0A1G9VVZ4_9EURY|nr:signal peptidase I [Halogranum gelatinilyticum]SDM76156.1 signal peptidase, endoplasmic reticulum-type [Halogranum gelatinilyticum]